MNRPEPGKPAAQPAPQLDQLAQLDQLRDTLAATSKLGDIRTIAKTLGRGQPLANKLWQGGTRNERLLAVLILDPKTLDPPALDAYLADTARMEPAPDALQVAAWLLANQIMKLPRLFPTVSAWIGLGEDTQGDYSRTPPHSLPSGTRELHLKQRLGWEWHAKTMTRNVPGKIPAETLLAQLELEMETAPEMVQWNMNYCAAQIGLAHKTLRERCIALGQRLGLYIDYPVPRGCTSPYLPTWISALAQD